MDCGRFVGNLHGERAEDALVQNYPGHNWNGYTVGPPVRLVHHRSQRGSIAL